MSWPQWPEQVRSTNEEDKITAITKCLMLKSSFNEIAQLKLQMWMNLCQMQLEYIIGSNCHRTHKNYLFVCLFSLVYFILNKNNQIRADDFHIGIEFLVKIKEIRMKFIRIQCKTFFFLKKNVVNIVFSHVLSFLIFFLTFLIAGGKK